MADPTAQPAIQKTNYNAPLFNNSPSDPAYLTQDLSPDNKLPWQQYFNPAVANTNDPNSLVSQQLSRGPDYYKNTTGYNVGATPTNFHTTPQTGTAPNPMADAISRKYQRDISGKLQSMQTQREAQAPVSYSNEQGKAGQILGTAQQLENKNFLEQYNFQLQRQQLYQQWKSQKNAADAAYTQSIIGGFSSVAAVGAA